MYYIFIVKLQHISDNSIRIPGNPTKGHDPMVGKHCYKTIHGLIRECFDLILNTIIREPDKLRTVSLHLFCTPKKTKQNMNSSVHPG